MPVRESVCNALVRTSFREALREPAPCPCRDRPLHHCPGLDDAGTAGRRPRPDAVRPARQPDLRADPVALLSGHGDGDASHTLLNIRPIILISIGKDVNLISRTILPVVSRDGVLPDGESRTGCGNTTQGCRIGATARATGGLIWGTGPVFSSPTAADGIAPTHRGAGPGRHSRRPDQGMGRAAGGDPAVPDQGLAFPAGQHGQARMARQLGYNGCRPCLPEATFA